ncbi:MAG: hypothetical protein ACRD3T_09275 [Terriglobia bacterium]
MKNQLTVAMIIVIAGAIILGGEFLLTNWYPGHRQRVVASTLKPLPYRSDSLGVEMRVAAGIYGKVRDFPGGIRIYRPQLTGGGPSIVITSLPNPSHQDKFSDQRLAELETQGVRKGIQGYNFEHTKINDRDAVMMWRYDPVHRWMQVTGRVIATDRIVQAVCISGADDQALFTSACEQSLRTIQLLGSAPSTSSSTAATAN